MEIKNSIHIIGARVCPKCGWVPPYASAYYPCGSTDLGLQYPRYCWDFGLKVVIHKCMNCGQRFDYYD